jgi:hypothetical protein
VKRNEKKALGEPLAIDVGRVGLANLGSSHLLGFPLLKKADLGININCASGNCPYALQNYAFEVLGLDGFH